MRIARKLAENCRWELSIIFAWVFPKLSYLPYLNGVFVAAIKVCQRLRHLLRKLYLSGKMDYLRHMIQHPRVLSSNDTLAASATPCCFWLRGLVLAWPLTTVATAACLVTRHWKWTNRCSLFSNALTYGGLIKMANILQITFSNAIFREKIIVFWFKFHWIKFVPRGHTDNYSSLIQILAWQRGDKSLSESITTPFHDATSEKINNELTTLKAGILTFGAQ